MPGEHDRLEDIAITEPPVPLRAWDSESGPRPDLVIEQDIRRLLRQVAEAESALARKQDENHEAIARMLVKVVGVLDGFDRIFANIESSPGRISERAKGWIGNFRSLRLVVEQLLSTNGVSAFGKSEGDFDPRLHTVLRAVEDPSRSDGSIVNVLRPGYEWRDRVLREAEVVVVKNPAIPAESGQGR